MLAEDTAPRSQPVLDQVVVELQHDVKGLLYLEIGEEESEHLHEVKHDLNHDSENHGKFPFRFKLVTVISLPIAHDNVLLKGKKYDEASVNDSNDGEGYETVYSRLLLLNHGLDLDDALVVRNECAEE